MNKGNKKKLFVTPKSMTALLPSFAVGDRAVKNSSHPKHTFLAEVKQGNSLPFFSSHTTNQLLVILWSIQDHVFHIFVLFLAGDFTISNGP
jgi:hypothetical protein